MIRECPELNISNYDEDDVANLNEWAIEADGVIVRLTDALRELHEFAVTDPHYRHGDRSLNAFQKAAELLRESEAAG